MPALKGNQYAKGNNGGRPRKVAEKDLGQFGKELVSWAEEKFEQIKNVPKDDKIPFFMRSFAREYGISQDTLTNYCKQSEEFFGSYKRAREIIGEALMLGGLKGWWHPTAFIFTAKNETDMKDRQEITGADGKDLIPEKNSEDIAKQAISIFLNGHRANIEQQ
jgi:hypothetical protein